MKFLTLFLVLFLTACAVPPIADVRQSLSDTRLAAVEAQALATQPGGGGKPVEHAAGEIIKAVDKAQPVVDRLAAVSDDVKGLKKSVADLTAANATLPDRVAAAAATVGAVAKTAHDTAPGTPVDNYASLANAAVMIAGMFFAHRTINTVATTPGVTTPAGQRVTAGGVG